MSDKQIFILVMTAILSCTSIFLAYFLKTDVYTLPPEYAVDNPYSNQRIFYILNKRTGNMKVCLVGYYKYDDSATTLTTRCEEESF